MKHIDLITSLWGDHHVGLFLNLTLPAMLSPGNLPALQGRGRLVIMTTPEDAETIGNHPAIALARQSVEVLIEAHKIEIEDKYTHRYGIQAYMNKAGMALSLKAGHMSSVFAGDMIFADGYCRALANWADEGKRLVLGIGLRAGLESAGQELAALNRDGIITISNRDTVKLGMAHMHPINQASTWGAPYFTRMPYTILFPVFGQGVSVRCFGLTALLLDTHEDVLSHKGNVDHDMPRFFPARDTYRVSDSDELMFCEVASIGTFWPIFTSYPASPEIVARWASQQACNEMWDNFGHRISFHHVDIDRRRWDKVDNYADGIVQDINTAARR